MMTKQDAVEEVNILLKKKEDKRYTSWNKHLMEERVKELVERFDIRWSDINDFRTRLVQPTH